MVRQRTTVQFKSLNAIDTDNLLLDEENVKIPARLFKSRQDKLTFAKNELPVNLQELLQDIYLFRIQWASLEAISEELFQNYEISGASIYIVPGQAHYEPVFDRFGEFTKSAFNIAFNSNNTVSMPTSATFHTQQPLKASIIDRFLRTLVPEGLDRISFITNFEMNYDNEKLSIQWVSSPYDLLITKSSHIRKEIALFQTSDLQNDLELSGIRIVLDEQDPLPPTTTLLFVKSRHHSLQDQVRFEFSKPIGLHPALKITNLSKLSEAPDQSCELFLYNTISNELFFDKYQYDKKSLALVSSWGEDDLEAPIWKVSQFGSIQLFQVNLDYIEDDIELNFHSRYLSPSQDNEFLYQTPEIFWACDAKQFVDDFEEISNNPFDSFGFGYESLFEDNTVFYHLEKSNKSLNFSIPRGNIDDSDFFQQFTLGALALGVSYIVFKLIRAFARIIVDDNEITTKKEK